MKNNSSSVGILGGGQLAQMLASSALSRGLSPKIYTATPKEGAGRMVPDIFIGSLTEAVPLGMFLEAVDVVMFENEFVDTSLLGGLSQDGVTPQFIPSLVALNLLQDKLRQKKTFSELGIPSSPYEALNPMISIEQWLGDVLKTLGGDVILKWSSMGYDGKGVLPHSKESKLEEAVKFCESAVKRGASVYAERRVAFTRELALVAVRSSEDEYAFFPLVISEQREGVCDTVYGPATFEGVDPKFETLARAYAKRLASSSGLVGTFALELFETDSGELLVNEVAPRVHNSGHFSIDACSVSQFDMHWKAVMGEPLGEIATKGPFAMVNLLGPKGINIAASKITPPELPMGCHLYWYDKAEVRPGRKVGHVNAVAGKGESLQAVVAKLRDYRAKWVRTVEEAVKKA